MNDNLRKTSKLIAKNALTANFGKILGISATSFLPQFILPMVFYYTTVLAKYTEMMFTTDPVIVEKLSDELMIYMLIYYAIQLGCALLFYPITARSVLMYSDIMKGKQTKYSDLFEYFADKRILKCYKIYLYTLWRSFLVSLPFLLVSIVVGIGIVFMVSGSSMAVTILAILGFYVIFFIGYVLMTGFMKPVAFMEVLSMVHIDDQFFKMKHAIKALNSSLPHSLSNFILFDLSFLGWSIVAGLASTMTFGLSTALLQAYILMASIVYAQTKYDEYNITQKIHPEI